MAAEDPSGIAKYLETMKTMAIAIASTTNHHDLFEIFKREFGPENTSVLQASWKAEDLIRIGPDEEKRLKDQGLLKKELKRKPI